MYKLALKGLVAAVSFFMLIAEVHADNMFVLYGFKIGQSSVNPENQFGEPFKKDTFEDGFSYKVFKMKDHFVIFESDNTRPDLIWAVQIQGKTNPQFLGLDGINLGDPVSKMIKKFGKPDSKKEAIDEVTNKPIAGVVLYSYNSGSNFSIETTDNIISSIKIAYNGPLENVDAVFDINKFLTAVRSKDLNRISRYIYTDFELYKEQTHKIDKSIVDTLKNNKEINGIFFNEDYGIISIRKGDVVESSMRYQTDPDIAGYVYKVKKKKAEYELFFFRNYDGWILKSVKLSK